jgi:hypothetical protein
MANHLIKEPRILPYIPVELEIDILEKIGYVQLWKSGWFSHVEDAKLRERIIVEAFANNLKDIDQSDCELFKLWFPFLPIKALRQIKSKETYARLSDVFYDDSNLFLVVFMNRWVKNPNYVSQLDMRIDRLIRRGPFESIRFLFTDRSTRRLLDGVFPTVPVGLTNQTKRVLNYESARMLDAAACQGMVVFLFVQSQGFAKRSEQALENAIEFERRDLASWLEKRQIGEE